MIRFATIARTRRGGTLRRAARTAAGVLLLSTWAALPAMPVAAMVGSWMLGIL